MIEETKFKAVDSVDLAVELKLDAVTKGYLHIRIRSLFPQTLLPFDVYCLAHRRDRSAVSLDRLFPRDRIYPLSFHQHLIKEEFDDAYISSDDEESYARYLSEHVQKALQGRSLSPEQRAGLLYDQAEFVVKKAFRERPSRSNIAIGKQLVAQFSEHVLTDEVTLQALFALFSKDYQTFSHCIQVAVYGMSLCRFLGWKNKEIEDFGLGALFHDIGKTSIHEQILNKPGKLDETEFDLIKRHPLLGYQQLRSTQMMSRDQLGIILYHHEAADGTGYPYRLKGRDIHKYARVARIVDIYDALTTKRPYKESFSMQEALQIMHDQMRPTMDEQFFAAFTKLRETETNTVVIGLRTRSQLEVGTRVQLQLEGRVNPLDGVLVGRERNRVLMFRIPVASQLEEGVQPGDAVTGKYLQAGTLYKFRSVLLKTAQHPYALVIIAYPREISATELPEETRLDCSIRAKTFIGNELYPGTVIDLRGDGCRVVVECPRQVVTIHENISISVEFSQEDALEPMVATVRGVEEDPDRVVVDVQFVYISPSTREAMDKLWQNCTPSESR